MIVVSVDMWPLGIERSKYRLGNIVITNDGSGDGETASYDIVFERLDQKTGIEAETRRVRVEDFRRANGVFALLATALDTYRQPGFPWQPIGTAPSHTRIQVCTEGVRDSWRPAMKVGGRWFSDFDRTWPDYEPTHWYYLPEIPGTEDPDEAKIRNENKHADIHVLRQGDWRDRREGDDDRGT